MADNVILNLGSGGKTVATDEIAGVQHQRVKVQHGADGSATDVSSASPLPAYLTGVNIDPKTQGIIAVESSHHELHEGHSLGVSAAVTATTLSFAFRVPAGTKRNHLLFEWAAEDKATFTVHQERTWTTNTGTVVAPGNRDHNSAIESQLEEDKSDTPNWTAGGVLQDATLVADGTIKHIEQSWAAKNAGGARERGLYECILENGKTYVFLLTSNNGAKGLWVHLSFYEHTDLA